MWTIHFTKKWPWELKPITIANRDWCKPIGGLWVSPMEAEESWEWWCKAESFNGLGRRVYLDINMKHAITIDSFEDLDKMNWAPMFPQLGIDRLVPNFEHLVSQGVDVVYLTAKGQWKTRLSPERDLYGWDCECLLILNERAIKKVRKQKPRESKD